MRLAYQKTVRALLVGSLAATTTLVAVSNASAGTSASPPTANLIVNGSFEEPSIWQSTDFLEYNAGSTVIPDWTIGGNSIDLTGSSYWEAEDGDQSVDLSGSAAGSVTQTVATTPGAYYTLSWYMAGNTNCGQPVKTMDVSWNGAVVDSPTFDISGDSGSSMGFAQDQIVVAATGASSTVEFADSTPDGSQCGAVLDNVSLTAAQIATPSFLVDSPSLAALQGAPYSAIFFASGVPTYSLAAGAPSWLSISATGAVSGTPPVGTSSFTYSVSAANADGSAVAGPFTVTAPAAAAVTGTVIDGGIAATPVPDAFVQACVIGGGECQEALTAADGSYSVPAPIGSAVVLGAYPPADRGDVSSATTPISVPAAGIQDETIALNGTAPLPSGLQINGSSAPTVYWANPSTATLTGCTNGLATVTVTGEDTTTGQQSSSLTVLTETPAGSGDYTGTLPPEEPVHGPVNVSSALWCQQESPLFPALGPATGGSSVLVTGSGFTGATAVTFGGVPATGVTVESDDAIEVTAPAGVGTVDVAVADAADPGGTVVGQYTYEAITSISPATGPAAGDTWVVIDGTGLLSTSAVQFGGVTAADFDVLSDSQIEALSPPGSGVQDITVTTLGGTSSPAAADQFTYTGSAGSTATAPRRPATARSAPSVPFAAAIQGPAPAFSAVKAIPTPTPTPATLGSGTVRPALPSLSGIGEAITAFIYNHGAAALSAEGFLVTMKNEINALLSSNPPNCDQLHDAAVQVIMASLAPLIDGLVETATPVVESLEFEFFVLGGPAAWVIGTVVRLLTPAILSLIADKIAEVLVGAMLNATTGSCPDKPLPPLPPLPTIPPPPGADPHCSPSVPQCGSQPNTFVDPSGTVLDTDGNPIDGAVVTILRADTAAGPFTPVDQNAAGIEPNINPQTTDSDGVFHWDVFPGWYEIQAVAPGCSNPDGNGQAVTIGPYPVPPPQTGLTITLQCPDELGPPTPAVDSLSQGSGPAAGGTALTILGSNFTPTSTVLFGTTPATAVTYLSPEELTVTSPPGTGQVDVYVQNQGVSSSQSTADQFFYGSAPAVTGLSPAGGSAAGGDSVTISGSGFTGASVVTFGGAPAASFTVDSDSQITATSPQQAVGTVDVQVSTPAGTSAPGSSDHYAFSGTAAAFTADTPSASATVGQPYDYAYAASGDPAPVFLVASGALPPGLSLDPDSGDLSGAPTTAGSYTFTVEADDSVGTPALSPATTVTVAPAKSPPPPPAPKSTVRLWGGTAIQTATAISGYDFANNGTATNDGHDSQGRIQAKAVVISRSNVFYDALAGSALAAQKKAPLLITPTARLDPGVAAEIERILPRTGTVYILGGLLAISANVENQLRALGYTNIDRLAGGDLYDTAVLIDQAITSHPTKVIVATGLKYYDALSAGAAAGATPGTVVVLTKGTVMPAVSAGYLNSLAPTLTAAYGAGGPGATALAAALRAKQVDWPASIAVRSEIGGIAADTSLLLANAFFAHPAFTAIATSSGWYDALTGGAAAGLNGGPLLLTAPTGLYGPDSAYISGQSKAGNLNTAAVLGGPLALPQHVFNQIQAALGS
jgi:large repetitive protein